VNIEDYSIDIESLCWLAGLLEGEGSFSTSRNTVGGKVYLYPKIVVSMTDIDIIDRVSILFKTSTYKIPETSLRAEKLPQYRATLTGSRAASLMKKLLPLMGIRRASRIKEVLEAYEAKEDTLTAMSKSCTVAQQARRKAERAVQA
jgi:hypothetical protein